MSIWHFIMINQEMVAISQGHLINRINHKRCDFEKQGHRWWFAGKAKQCQANTNTTTCLAHRYSDVFRNSLFHHPSFLRDVIGSDQHIGMLCAPCFVSGVPLRACKHASSYYVHSPVAGKGMLESIFF